jgi:GxxExxY protein
VRRRFSASFFLKYPRPPRNNIGMKPLPELKHAEITGPLIELFYQVYRSLGYGFLERVYGNAMDIAGRKVGLEMAREVPILVHFEGTVIGEYHADLVVNHAVIAELKAVKALAPEHEAQLLNYLKATRFEVGLLFNFGPKPQYKRMIYENGRKGSLSWSSPEDAGRFLSTRTDADGR